MFENADNGRFNAVFRALLDKNEGVGYSKCSLYQRRIKGLTLQRAVLDTVGVSSSNLLLTISKYKVYNKLENTEQE